MTTPANDNVEAVIPSKQLLFDLPREQYDRLQEGGETNWSTLRHMGKSAAHFKYALDNPGEDPTDTMERGIAAHVATLEPEKYGGKAYDALDASMPADGSLYAVWPTANGKRGTKAWEGAEALCKLRRQTLIREVDHEWCVRIASAVRAKKCARELLKGKREVTLRWSESVGAVGGGRPFTWRLRGRVDLVAELGLVDLKSTKDASVDGFMRQVAMYGYHAQAAFYLDGYRQITGKRVPYFWIAVEATPPHPVTVIEVPESVLGVGRDLYWEHLQLLRVCTEKGEFPEYAEGIVTGAELPRWAQPFDEENDTNLAGELGTPPIGF